MQGTNIYFCVGLKNVLNRSWFRRNLLFISSILEIKAEALPNVWSRCAYQTTLRHIREYSTIFTAGRSWHIRPGPHWTEKTETKKRNSDVCDKSAAILQHLRNISETRLCFLQLPVPLPVGKDQNVSVLLKVPLTAGWSQCSADLQQCAEDMDLTIGMWSTEEMCKINFFSYT